MTTVTITTLTVDPTSVTKEKFVEPSLFGAIRTVINPDTDLQKVYLFTELNVGAARQMSLRAEGELLKAREEEIGNLKAPVLLKEVEAAEAIHLRVKASNFETIEKSLRDEANALRKRNFIFKKE
nr:hypothetical protein [Tanacetum cinerariifolium]